MFRKSMKGRIVSVTAALAVIGAGGATVAAASGGASGNAYAGCLAKAGNLYNVHVNPAHRLHCRHGGKVMRWNQTGPVGPQGPQGPPGPQGAVGASPAINGTVVSDTNVSIPTGTAATTDLDCPPGDIATGGGGGFPTPGNGLVIQDSEPLMTGGSPTGWHMIVDNTSGATATFNQFTVCLAASGAQTHLARPVHEAARVRLTAIKP